MFAPTRMIRGALPLLRARTAPIHLSVGHASARLPASVSNVARRSPVTGWREVARPASGIRRYSVISEDHKAKLYDYEAVKKIVLEKDKHPECIIVDVREPVEFKDGSIPGAINVPFKSSPGAFGLSAEEFEDNFGFEKPDKNKELIFYCLAGVRSTAAEELANTFGYKHRGNYVGSYEDWLSNTQKAKK